MLNLDKKVHAEGHTITVSSIEKKKKILIINFNEICTDFCRISFFVEEKY